MQFLIKIIKYYLNFLGFISPKLAGNRAFNLFQGVTLKKIKKIEEEFYNITTHFTIPFETEDLNCYILEANKTAKKENIKTVFLIHGWNSNIGCMTLFAKELAKQNYRVIGFNLPGHATYKKSKNNLLLSKNAFIKLVKYINPKQPISIISHSFGSTVTAYALSNLNYKVNKIVFLSSNNKLSDIFNHFKNMFKFNNKVFYAFKRKAEKYLNEKESDMVVFKKLNQAKFNKLLLIHDRFDKVIPFKDAETVHKNVKNSIVIPFEKIGHYRMLWNEDVVRETVDFLKD